MNIKNAINAQRNGVKATPEIASLVIFPGI